MKVTVLIAVFSLALFGVFIYLLILLIKALRRYINSKPVRQKKAESAKSLGEVIKTHRMSCNMTQEFVAESLGVSRQAVSKWENGTSDPSTSNLIALSKLLFENNGGESSPLLFLFIYIVLGKLFF